MKPDLTQKIKNQARSLGFDLVGIAPAQPLQKDFEYFKNEIYKFINESVKESTILKSGSRFPYGVAKPYFDTQIEFSPNPK